MQARNSISPLATSKVSESASVFGGPLSIRGNVRQSTADESMKNEILQKKLKKRLQLKNLIVTKFKNKYCVSAEFDDQLNRMIEQEIDSLFSLDQFDERDLVAVDQKVREYIKSQKEKDTKIQKPSIQQATLASARLLEGKVENMGQSYGLASIAQKTLAETVPTKRSRQSQHNSFHSIRNSGKSEDIFSVRGSKRGLSINVAENNRIATQIMSKRLLTGSRIPDSESDYGNTGAQLLIKARQDDYWNKIAIYNKKLSVMEQQEAAEKKRQDQMRMREELNDQLNHKNLNRSEQANKDRLYMAQLTQKAMEQENEEKKKKFEKKKKLQEINKERTEHQAKLDEQYSLERKTLVDYQTEILKKIKDKEEQDKKKKEEIFKARKQNAEINIEKFKKLKIDYKLERDAEKSKWSPQQNKGSLTPTAAAQNDETSQKNSTMYSTLRETTAPVYNDIFNDLFTAKRHQAYSRRERTDKRTAFIGEKFKDVWTVGNAEMDRKIKEEFEQRTKMNALFMEERDQKRRELMLKTKEYQTKQMKDKQVIQDSDKKKQWDEYEQDLHRIQQIDQSENQSLLKKKEKFQANKEELFKQMEEKQLQSLNEDMMNKTDYKMNRRILLNLDQPVLAPRDKRKPF